MSQLFEPHIQLKPSSDYRRLGFLFIALTIGELFYASPPGVMLAIIVILLGLSGYHLLQSSYPHPNWQCLFRQHEHWVIQDINGQLLTYNKMRICVDTGFFLLIKLTGIKGSKLIVIFYDQLDRRDLRTLTILSAIL